MTNRGMTGFTGRNNYLEKGEIPDKNIRLLKESL